MFPPSHHLHESPGPEITFLIFSLALLFLFDFPALECFQCHRVNASGVCESGESFCQTQGSQHETFHLVVGMGDTISYGYQGCSSLCVPMKLFKLSVTVEFRCCHDSPLCNKF
uniref:UPAR/Ly6 domain-containing protein n=1 Tax=Balaenoptera musculus TaxID=9771 RepID=A0A8C0D9W7_BALMU